MEDMIMERSWFGSCVIRNRIYVFGSISPDLMSSVEVYDITTNKWTALANLPQTIGDPHVCTNNRTIYIIGGFCMVAYWIYASDLNYAYDPESDSFVPKENYPFPTASSPSCELNDKFYIFGNRPKQFPFKEQKKAFAYDPATDIWAPLPDMSFEHTNGDAVSIYNKIYIIGGVKDMGLFANQICYSKEGRSELFDPETNSYTLLMDMHFPISCHSSIVYRNKIYVFGGDTADYQWGYAHGTNLIQEYDPITDTWRLMKGMPITRFACKAERAGDFVYLIGGCDYTNANPLKEVWRFDLNYLEPLATSEQLLSPGPECKLLQNYPNPFSGSTQIRYEIAEPDEVNLDIINYLGREVIALDHGMKNPGSYSITWDAKGINPGLYFCRLRAGRAEKVMKLVVLP
jgi:hypothetical protein